MKHTASDELREQLRAPIAATTQHEVARRSGIPQPNISAWLAGRRPMNLDACERLAHACGYELRVTARRRPRPQHRPRPR